MLNILKNIYKKFKAQCSSTKILLIIGVVCLLNTTFVVLLSNTTSTSSDIAIRSTMASIFGYIFGEHCLPNEFGNKGIQIIAAGSTSLICLTVLVILHWTNNIEGTNSSVELRNLLFSSVGFLISKAKNDEDKTCK